MHSATSSIETHVEESTTVLAVCGKNARLDGAVHGVY